jgi:glycosyltransferase involved in cell wall biosynthesis
MLAPVAWRTPPRHYGPWERVTSLLTEGLVRRGLDVTLFATGDSVTSARLDAVLSSGYAEDTEVDGRISEALHVGHALGRSGEFDIIHSHLDWLPLALGGAWQAPLVTTVHGFSGPAILPAYRAGRPHLVSISDADRAPELDYIATIYHGIDFAEFPAGPHAGDGLISLGRIHPDKGTADAIAIAKCTGRPLIICGPIHDADYFAAEVEPHLGSDIIFLGSVGPDDRAHLLGQAAVLLHPIAFDEPFGLSVVEAMACGTPVVAYRHGSMSEVIDDGVTGFAVTTQDAAVAAVGIAAWLDRDRVRAVARERFGVERMVESYIAVYEQILERPHTNAAYAHAHGDS